MKRKTAKVTEFMDEMHTYVVNHPQFRKKTKGKSEVEIQREIRPILIEYLTKYFTENGVKDALQQAHKSFYWEGQEGKYGKARPTIFGARNYPDFIITEPYLIAIEYKQSPNGSAVKHGIGQSIMHTLTEEFHYVYYLFHDQSDDKRIESSANSEPESSILKRMWMEFNVHIVFV